MRTRKLASERQKEKNFMGALRLSSPLPLWERVARIVRCETGEGSVSADRGPSSGALCAPPSPTRGEGREVLPRAHGLLAPGQVHRAGAPGRMRGDVVGGDSGHWRPPRLLRRR